MFTEEEIQFYIENQEFFERLWEPRFGDLVICWNADRAEWSKDLWIVIGIYSEDAVDVFRERDGAIGPVLIVDAAPLLTLSQLLEMLEERGCSTWELKPLINALYQCSLRDRNLHFRNRSRIIAVARALMEVAKEGR